MLKLCDVHDLQLKIKDKLIKNYNSLFNVSAVACHLQDLRAKLNK